MTTYQMWDEVPGLHNEIPVLDYYPAEDKKSKATVVICPGGGYGMRAKHEGEGYALYFNSIGMDAFVCQYRVSPHRFPLPLLDARRAVRFVRANAEKFDIDPDKVAIMGSSAGGHLAALTSTYTAPIEFESDDAIDAICSIPNATILCYPVIHMPDDTKIAHEGSYINLLGQENLDMAAAVSPDLIANEKTPTAFIWHTSDDGGVNVINSYRYGEALRKLGKPCEIHIFPNGPHGLGLAPNLPHVAQWAGLMKNWLADMGWL